jgi:hypothetical protein
MSRKRTCTPASVIQMGSTAAYNSNDLSTLRTAGACAARGLEPIACSRRANFLVVGTNWLRRDAPLSCQLCPSAGAGVTAASSLESAAQSSAAPEPIASKPRTEPVGRGLQDQSTAVLAAFLVIFGLAQTRPLRASRSSIALAATRLGC